MKTQYCRHKKLNQRNLKIKRSGVTPYKKPVVDKETCQGHMVCVGIAPEVFEIGDGGKSNVTDPEEADETTIQQAIDGCPVGTIG